MLGIKLVRLIENHSEALSESLIAQIRMAERTSDFQKIPAKDLRLAATELYRNLGEWLLQKTESDIESRFRAIAARRAAEGIRLHQLAWALMLTRDHLWSFLRQQALPGNIVVLHGELELQVLLDQFFDRAIFYAILGYEEAVRQNPAKGELAKARDLAISIGLMADRQDAYGV